MFHEGTPLEWLQPLLFVFILGLTIALMVRQASEMKKLEQTVSKKREFITVISCGDKEVRRPFKEGDFVGKKVSECDGGEGLIHYIIVKGEKKEEKSSKGLKSLFKI